MGDQVPARFARKNGYHLAVDFLIRKKCETDDKVIVEFAEKCN